MRWAYKWWDVDATVADANGKGVKYSGRGWIANVTERPVTVFAVGTNQEEKKKRRLATLVEQATIDFGFNRPKRMQNPFATNGCYPGYMPMTEAECKAFAAEKASKGPHKGTIRDYEGTSSRGGYPKGCYADNQYGVSPGVEGWSNVRFNTHATGGPHSSYFPLCKNNANYVVRADLEYSMSMPGMNACFDGYTAMTKAECKVMAKDDSVYASLTWLDGDNGSGGGDPKGCISSDTEIWFNPHATGSSDIRYAPICKISTANEPIEMLQVLRVLRASKLPGSPNYQDPDYWERTRVHGSRAANLWLAEVDRTQNGKLLPAVLEKNFDDAALDTDKVAPTMRATPVTHTYPYKSPMEMMNLNVKRSVPGISKARGELFARTTLSRVQSAATISVDYENEGKNDENVVFKVKAEDNNNHDKAAYGTLGPDKFDNHQDDPLTVYRDKEHGTTGFTSSQCVECMRQGSSVGDGIAAKNVNEVDSTSAPFVCPTTGQRRALTRHISEELRKIKGPSFDYSEYLAAETAKHVVLDGAALRVAVRDMHKTLTEVNGDHVRMFVCAEQLIGGRDALLARKKTGESELLSVSESRTTKKKKLPKSLKGVTVCDVTLTGSKNMWTPTGCKFTKTGCSKCGNCEYMSGSVCKAKKLKGTRGKIDYRHTSLKIAVANMEAVKGLKRDKKKAMLRMLDTESRNNRPQRYAPYPECCHQVATAEKTAAQEAAPAGSCASAGFGKKCDLSTPLRNNQCCDKSCKQVRKGKQMTSFRWCRDDSELSNLKANVIDMCAGRKGARKGADAWCRCNEKNKLITSPSFCNSNKKYCEWDSKKKQCKALPSDAPCCARAGFGKTCTGLSTDLDKGQCCDKSCKQATKGKQKLSYRWCKTDSGLSTTCSSTNATAVCAGRKKAKKGTKVWCLCNRRSKIISRSNACNSKEKRDFCSWDTSKKQCLNITVGNSTASGSESESEGESESESESEGESGSESEGESESESENEGSSAPAPAYHAKPAYEATIILQFTQPFTVSGDSTPFARGLNGGQQSSTRLIAQARVPLHRFGLPPVIHEHLATYLYCSETECKKKKQAGLAESYKFTSKDDAQRKLKSCPAKYSAKIVELEGGSSLYVRECTLKCDTPLKRVTSISSAVHQVDTYTLGKVVGPGGSIQISWPTLGLTYKNDFDTDPDRTMDGFVAKINGGSHGFVAAHGTHQGTFTITAKHASVVPMIKGTIGGKVDNGPSVHTATIETTTVGSTAGNKIVTLSKKNDTRCTEYDLSNGHDACAARGREYKHSPGPTPISSVKTWLASSETTMGCVPNLTVATASTDVNVTLVDECLTATKKHGDKEKEDCSGVREHSFCPANKTGSSGEGFCCVKQKWLAGACPKKMEVTECKGEDCSGLPQMTFCPPHRPGSSGKGFCCVNAKWTAGVCPVVLGINHDNVTYVDKVLVDKKRVMRAVTAADVKTKVIVSPPARSEGQTRHFRAAVELGERTWEFVEQHEGVVSTCIARPGLRVGVAGMGASSANDLAEVNMFDTPMGGAKSVLNKVRTDGRCFLCSTRTDFGADLLHFPGKRLKRVPTASNTMYAPPTSSAPYTSQLLANFLSTRTGTTSSGGLANRLFSDADHGANECHAGYSPMTEAQCKKYASNSTDWVYHGSDNKASLPKGCIGMNNDGDRFKLFGALATQVKVFYNKHGTGVGVPSWFPICSKVDLPTTIVASGRTAGRWSAGKNASAMWHKGANYKEVLAWMEVECGPTNQNAGCYETDPDYITAVRVPRLRGNDRVANNNKDQLECGEKYWENKKVWKAANEKPGSVLLNLLISTSTDFGSNDCEAGYKPMAEAECKAYATKKENNEGRIWGGTEDNWHNPKGCFGRVDGSDAEGDSHWKIWYNEHDVGDGDTSYFPICKKKALAGTSHTGFDAWSANERLDDVSTWKKPVIDDLAAAADSDQTVPFSFKFSRNVDDEGNVKPSPCPAKHQIVPPYKLSLKDFENSQASVYPFAHSPSLRPVNRLSGTYREYTSMGSSIDRYRLFAIAEAHCRGAGCKSFHFNVVNDATAAKARRDSLGSKVSATQGDGKYFIQPVNTNDCPLGYAPMTEKGCAEWSTSEGLGAPSVGSWDHDPVGCFRREDERDMFFNTHHTGSVDSTYSPICRLDPYVAQTERTHLIGATPIQYSARPAGANDCNAGFVPMSNWHECKAYADSTNGRKWDPAIDNSVSYPKGCFSADRGNDQNEVWFNNHATGSKGSEEYFPICKAAIASKGVALGLYVDVAITLCGVDVYDKFEGGDPSNPEFSVTANDIKEEAEKVLDGYVLVARPRLPEVPLAAERAGSLKMRWESRTWSIPEGNFRRLALMDRVVDRVVREQFSDRDPEADLWVCGETTWRTGAKGETTRAIRLPVPQDGKPIPKDGHKTVGVHYGGVVCTIDDAVNSKCVQFRTGAGVLAVDDELPLKRGSSASRGGYFDTKVLSGTQSALPQNTSALMSNSERLYCFPDQTCVDELAPDGPPNTFWSNYYKEQNTASPSSNWKQDICKKHNRTLVVAPAVPNVVEVDTYTIGKAVGPGGSIQISWPGLSAYASQVVTSGAAAAATATATATAATATANAAAAAASAAAGTAEAAAATATATATAATAANATAAAAAASTAAASAVTDAATTATAATVYTQTFVTDPDRTMDGLVAKINGGSHVFVAAPGNLTGTFTITAKIASNVQLPKGIIGGKVDNGPTPHTVTIEVTTRGSTATNTNVAKRRVWPLADPNSASSVR